MDVEMDPAAMHHNGFMLSPKKAYLIKVRTQNEQLSCKETAKDQSWNSVDDEHSADVVVSDYFFPRNTVDEISDVSDIPERTFLQKMPTKIFSRKVRVQQKDEKVQSCPICAETFKTTPLLLGHMLEHTGEKPHVCDFCGSTFARQSDLEVHARIHVTKPLSCRICNRSFASANILNKHLCNCNYYREKPFICLKCGRRFCRQAELTKHMHAHNNEAKRYECETCGKTFSQSFRLKMHMRTHTGEKPFACSLCGANFIRADTLKHHMRTHSGEKPYSCKICGKTFAQAASLTVHKKTHSGEKLNMCDLCGKKFSRAYHLRRHRETHSGEKPYTCEVCGKAFTQDSGLKMHSSIHSGEKPHKCSVCDKGFARAWHLKRHYETHEKSSKKKSRLKASKDGSANTDPNIAEDNGQNSITDSSDNIAGSDSSMTQVDTRATLDSMPSATTTTLEVVEDGQENAESLVDNMPAEEQHANESEALIKDDNNNYESASTGVITKE